MSVRGNLFYIQPRLFELGPWVYVAKGAPVGALDYLRGCVKPTLCIEETTRRFCFPMQDWITPKHIGVVLRVYGMIQTDDKDFPLSLV